MTKPRTDLTKNDIKALKDTLLVARKTEVKCKGTVHEKRAKRLTNAVQNLITDIRNEDILK